jgi:hypothetical protein
VLHECHARSVVQPAEKSLNSSDVSLNRQFSDASAVVAILVTMSDTRRKRQHAEIVGLLLAGEVSRACALAAEHLDEFPADQVVSDLFTTCCGDASR